MESYRESRGELWRRDEDGWYLRAKDSGGDSVVFRPDNTTVYLHGMPHEEVDHIFYVANYNQETDTGDCIYVWRHNLEFFDELVADMRLRGFDVIEEDSPDDRDVRKYEEYTGEVYDAIGKIVTREVAHLDEEIVYYMGEWT